jgi:flagellin
MLQRMRELALQAVHGSNNDTDREALDAEVQQLKTEIDRISETTSFNNQMILNGTFNKLFQIGSELGNTVRIGVNAVDSASLGLETGTTETTSNVNTLVSARLSNTFSWDADANTALVGWSLNIVTGIIFAAGDIEING